MQKVYVLNKFQHNPYSGLVVDTTSRGGTWSGLSPFLLSAEKYGSRNFENLWQYSKVYPEHAEQMGLKYVIKNDWFDWSQAGYNNPSAVRYPMGKGRKPLFSFWLGQKLGYIEARKKIYIPIYAELVQLTESFAALKTAFQTQDLVLRDYDGYDYTVMGLTLGAVANDPSRKCGHAFVLAALLLGQLDQML